MKTRIIVDSTADLMPEFKSRVHTVPLTVHFGEEEYIDGVTIDHKAFYEKLIESDVLPTTSQATPEAFIKEYEKAKKYLNGGASGVISFGVKGGRDAAVKFMDSLKLAAIVVHVADARTSVLHPASTTHRQLTDEQLVNAGITPDLVRLSVGIENVNDIIADIEQALTESQK